MKLQTNALNDGVWYKNSELVTQKSEIHCKQVTSKQVANSLRAQISSAS